MNAKQLEAILAKIADSKPESELQDFFSEKIFTHYKGRVRVVGLGPIGDVNQATGTESFTGDKYRSMFVQILTKDDEGNFGFSGRYHTNLQNKGNYGDPEVWKLCEDLSQGIDLSNNLDPEDWFEIPGTHEVVDLRYKNQYFVPQAGSVTLENPAGKPAVSTRTGKPIMSNKEIVVKFANEGADLQNKIRNAIAQRAPMFGSYEEPKDNGPKPQPKPQQQQQQNNQA